MNLEKHMKYASKEDLAHLEILLSLNNLKDKYSYIYDIVCNQLDNIFQENNYCNFIDDKCIAQRNCKNISHDSMGCCYTFRNSKLTGFPVDTKLCTYLHNGKCTQNCISCKLYTCSYLKKQNIKFSPNDFFLIKVFFNGKQKSYIKSNFFKTRDEIIDNLVKMNSKL